MSINMYRQVHFEKPPLINKWIINVVKDTPFMMDTSWIKIEDNEAINQ